MLPLILPLAAVSLLQTEFQTINHVTDFSKCSEQKSC